MNNIEWSPPTSLHRDKSSLPTFPINCLPPVPKAMALGIAQTTSTDISMSATAILSALSFCFSGVYRMEGKPDHAEPITLYSLILAEPAERKSPIMRFVKAPFVTFGKEYNEKNADKIYASWEQQALLQIDIDKMQKNGEATPEEIAQKRNELESLPMLSFRNVCVDDITPEALANLLLENETMLMISDEAGVFKNFGGRYNNGMANLDLFLKCWGGESYQKNRCNSSPLFLKRPYLSVCLCGQPYILEDMMSNKSFLSSGMVARFLFCFPKSYVGTRTYNTKSLDIQFIESYKNLVYSAIDFKFEYYGENEMRLHFTAEAQKTFADYYDNSIEPVLLTDFAECPDWGGKYHGLILRLCGLLHCIKCVSENVSPESKEVELLTLGRAIDIADFYKQQARYAYGLMGANPVSADAEYILKKLRANHVSVINGRELFHLCRKFKTVDELCQPIEILTEHGYLREQQQEFKGTGRRPSIVYEVNPLSA